MLYATTRNSSEAFTAQRVLTGKRGPDGGLFVPYRIPRFSREEILETVWGRDYVGELKIVDVNIRRLRIKLEDDAQNPTYITTVWGYGYKWGF